MIKKLLLYCFLLVGIVISLANAQRITESLDNWTLGTTPPEISTGTRGDGSTGSYLHLLVGTSPMYYEVMMEGEGAVQFWIYDPGNCLESVDPGYGTHGPKWGLQSPLYQCGSMGISRPSYAAGCQGYSPWSTVSPYSHWWFQFGLRGANGVPFSPGWYKWQTVGTWDNMTFTLYNVDYKESSNGPTLHGDVSMIIDAFSFGGSWAALFGEGWKAFWLRGDGASGIEDVNVDCPCGTGVFDEFGACSSNRNPTITSSAVTSVYEDSPYLYNVNATDPDPGTVLSFSLTTKPTGMAINSTSGLIQWSPQNQHVGANPVSVRVSDGQGGYATQNFTVTVINTNDPPVITSAPDTLAEEDILYQYQVQVTEVDKNDTLTYALLSGPDSLNLNTRTGLISWLPDLTDTGRYLVKIKVTDQGTAADSQEYFLTVLERNDPPQVTSMPNTNAIEDFGYSYQVTATDEESSTLYYYLIQGPDSMVIDSVTGRITWTPHNADVGGNYVSVRVADGEGGTTDHIFTITVMNTNDEPVITSTPILVAQEDSQYIYQVAVTEIDVGDVLTYKLITAPAGMTISGQGLVLWQPQAADIGTTQVMLEVSDGNGGKAAQFYSIIVSHTNHLPTVPQLQSPNDGAQVGDGSALLWTTCQDADSGDVVTYRLEVCSDNNFNAPEAVETGLIQAGIFIKDLKDAANLQPLSVYYWRVRAEDNQGGKSAYSHYRYFAYLGPTGILGRRAGEQPEAMIVVYNNNWEKIVSVKVPASQEFKVRLYDINGLELFLKKSTANTYWLSDAGSRPGICFLQVVGKGFKRTYRIYIMR